MRESQPLSVSPDPRPQGPAASRSVAQDPVALWTSRAFIQQAQSWVAAQLAPSGSRLTGEWDQPHARAWSSAIRFETTEGRVWFKVNAGGTAYEASLIALLGELNPGLAPDVIAHDEARVWSLTRDAGPVLRAIAEPDGLWGRWERLLPWYAEVQLALAEHRSRLLAAAVPDLGPNQLPVQYRRLLTELAGRAIDDGGLAPEQARALERVVPRTTAGAPSSPPRQFRTACNTMICTPTMCAGPGGSTTCPRCESSIGAMRRSGIRLEPCSPP
jgi:hypothetical protein